MLPSSATGILRPVKRASTSTACVPSLPVHRRISEDIRRRIEAGELAPGDRVPSTRELARTWGTATATAAHALRNLAHAGVVRAVPRIGNVVAAPRGARAARPRDAELSRDRIVEAAVALADAEGLPALSLRAVAARIGAPVMSLYRHVSSKDALLSLMTDTVLGEEKLPAKRPTSVRVALELAAHTSYRTIKRHPWLVRTLLLSRPEPLPNAVRYADWVLGALAGHGLDAATRMRIHILIHGFVQGFAVNLESEAEAVGVTGMTHDQWVDSQLTAFSALAESGEYPAFAAVLGELDAGFDLNMDELFALGLGALLDGIELRIMRRHRTGRVTAKPRR